MRNLIILLATFVVVSACEKSFLRANDEFYGQSLDQQIKGYDIWAEEAEQFANKNKWPQQINAPLIGYFDVEYYKKQKANDNISLRLNYIVDVNAAISRLEKYADSLGFVRSSSNMQAGLTFTPALGLPVYQTWTIPYDSLVSKKQIGVSSLKLGYEQFKSDKAELRSDDGTLSFINLNGVNNKTVFTPEDAVKFYSSYGLVGDSKKRVSRTMGAAVKFKEYLNGF